MKNEKLENLRHTAEHVLHTAMQELYPSLKKVMGPPIDTGFYFDFDLGEKISPEDFPKIEARMREIIEADLKMEMGSASVGEARELFAENDYKLNTLQEIIDRGEEITVCTMGGKRDVDLCKGGHEKTTGKVKTFKLLSVAGAYYKGDEKNKMLQRIYGTAFYSQKDLDEYLENLELAKKNDHRKLGKELDLFTFSDLVGPGLPLYTPKGTVIIEQLKKSVEQICYEYGFKKVMTPHLAKIKLYELSGHAQKFSEELFHVSSARGHEFVMKPVQCPHQTQIYASKVRSYRDLPIRYMESERQYRAEQSGEIGGLNRVYAITVEDGHSFCTIDQVKDEIKGMVNIIKNFYSILGLWDSSWVSLSVRDYSDPKKYIGNLEDWNKAEEILEEISDEMGLDAKKCEGEAALYGPKLDFMFKDSLGKEIQIPTVQIDFATPQRFGLLYINKDGEKIHPVMVHRAILGSYERFLALIIEHFGGAFPVWLSPIQVNIIPVSEKHLEYAHKLEKEFKESNIRIEISDKDSTMGAKIREAQEQKIPYMVIVGDKEKDMGNISVRFRNGEQENDIKVEKFIERVTNKIESKALDL